MKNLKSLIIIICLLFTNISCSDKEETTVRVIPKMSMEVSSTDDGIVTLTSEQTQGETFGAKVLEYYPISDITFDYNIEVKLVKFVEENGAETNLPYHKTIDSGLKPGVNYISAIIAYNKEGRAVCSAFKTWKASGTEGMWTKDNSAGKLDDNQW
jgi:hypothetical protein